MSCWIERVLWSLFESGDARNCGCVSVLGGKREINWGTFVPVGVRERWWISFRLDTKHTRKLVIIPKALHDLTIIFSLLNDNIL